MCKGGGGGVGGVASSAAGPCKMTDTRRRVKLYELNAERQWDDKGTGETNVHIIYKHLLVVSIAVNNSLTLANLTREKMKERYEGDTSQRAQVINNQVE